MGRDRERRRRGIGYVRVSTSEQVVEGFSLDAQRRAIRAWARENRVRLVDIVSDEGVSGANGLDTRPGIAHVLQTCEGGGADVLVVTRLDRLHRNFVTQEMMLERLATRGVQVVSITEPLADRDDELATMVRQVLGAVKQYERALVSRRLREGKAEQRARGEWTGGQVPFGMRADHGKLVPDPAEQKAIRFARKLHRRGRSLRDIAKALEDRGVRPKQGGSWHPNSVRRLLAR